MNSQGTVFIIKVGKRINGGTRITEVRSSRFFSRAEKDSLTTSVISVSKHLIAYPRNRIPFPWGQGLPLPFLPSYYYSIFFLSRLSSSLSLFPAPVPSDAFGNVGLPRVTTVSNTCFTRLTHLGAHCLGSPLGDGFPFFLWLPITPAWLGRVVSVDVTGEPAWS